MKHNHEKFGIALLVLTLQQVTIAYTRPHTTEKRKTSLGVMDVITKRRFSWSLFHHVVGIIILFGGFANCFIGADLIEAFNEEYVDPLTKIVSILCATYVVLFFLRVFQLFCVATKYNLEMHTNGEISNKSLCAKPSWVQKTSPHWKAAR